MKRIGVQLYTVRDLLTSDDAIRSTLMAIRDIGYDHVQLYGAVELAESCSKIAKEIGLEIIGISTNLSRCEDTEKDLFNMCSKYGLKDIGISSNFSECQDIDTYISRVNAFAKKTRSLGFSFSYHNHGHEFIKLDCGKTAMNCFLNGFDSEMVDFMPDTYWIHDGGYDVRYFLEQTQNRVKILHLKDMKRTERGHTFAEVGNGNLYFDGIIKTALDCGIEYFVVEQDICEGDPLEALQKSYQYIKTALEL